jgi:O-antigen ligase
MRYPLLKKIINSRLYDFFSQRRNLTVCLLLVIAYLVVSLILHFPYFYIALVIVGISLLFIVLKYPFAAYLGYILIIHFIPYGFIISNEYTVAKIGGVLLLGLTLAYMAIRKSEIKERIKFAFDKRGGLVIIIIIAGVLSTAFSSNPNFSFFERNFQFLIIFALTRIYINNERRLWWTLIIILIARGADNILGAYQYITLPVTTRISGYFQDPNSFACYSLVALPIAIYLFNYKKNIYYRLAIIVLGLSTVTAVVISSSRSGFITLAVLILLIMLIPVHKFKNRLIILFLTILIIISFTPIDYWTRIESVKALFTETEEMDRSLQIRKSQFETSFRFFLENPILGIGYGEYGTKPEELLGGYVIKQKRLQEHSTFLKFLVEFGLAGFIPFVILLVVTLRDGIRAIKKAKSVGEHGIRLLATATTLSLTSFIIFSLMLGTYSKYLYLYVALPIIAFDLISEKISRSQKETESPSEKIAERNPA